MCLKGITRYDGESRLINELGVHAGSRLSAATDDIGDRNDTFSTFSAGGILRHSANNVRPQSAYHGQVLLLISFTLSHECR